MIKLIGLTGKARSGKDTLAAMFTELHGFEDYAFAKPMKEACKAIFGWTDAHVHGDLKEITDVRYGVSPREALQTIGTEWGRNTINENIWLIRAQKEIEKAELIVITDVRFDNEAELIHELGGVVLEVIRPLGIDVRHHASEKGISKKLITATVHNSGTINDLRRTAIAILEM